MKTAGGVVAPDILEYVNSGEGVRTRIQAVLSVSPSSWLNVSLFMGTEPRGVTGMHSCGLLDACQCD